MVLNAAPSANVTITVSGVSGDVTFTTQGQVRPTTLNPTGNWGKLTFTTSNWNVPQWVRVWVREDADMEDDTDVTLTPSGGGVLGFWGRGSQSSFDGREGEVGLDALFAHDPLSRRLGSDQGGRWTMEAGYGLPAFRGRFVGAPQLSYGVSAGAREVGVGWRRRLAPERAAGAPDLVMAIRAARREGPLESADHRIDFEFRARWQDASREAGAVSARRWLSGLVRPRSFGAALLFEPWAARAHT